MHEIQLQSTSWITPSQPVRLYQGTEMSVSNWTSFQTHIELTQQKKKKKKKKKEDLEEQKWRWRDREIKN